MLTALSALLIAANTLTPSVLPYQTSKIAEETTTTVGTEEKVEKTDAVQEKLKARVEEKKTKLQEIRDAAKARLDARKIEFKEGLTKVREEKKKATLERLVAKYDTLNEKWIANWKAKLDKLTALVTRMDTKAAELAAAGSSTAAYTTASDNAKVKIAEAVAAVEKQAANTYVFDIESEAALKAEVAEVNGQFRTDLQTVHTAMKAAREAVGASLTALKGVSK